MIRMFMIIAMIGILFLFEACRAADEGKITVSTNVNLLKNGSFESDTTGKMPDYWKFWPASNLCETVENGKFDKYSLKLVKKLPEPALSVCQNVDMKPRKGQFYTFSVWIKCDQPKAQVNISISAEGDNANARQDSGVYIATTDGWQQKYNLWNRYSVTLPIRNNLNQRLTCGIAMYGNGYVAEIDGAKLELGPNPTEFGK